MIWIAVVATVVAVFAIVIAPSVAPSSWGLSAPTDASQWGEYLGGPLAAVAMGWFVAAVFLQKKELFLQRKELELQRAELARLSDEAAAGNKLQQAQNVISTLQLRRAAINSAAKSLADAFPEQLKFPGRGTITLGRTGSAVTDASNLIKACASHGTAEEVLSPEELHDYVFFAKKYQELYADLISECAICNIPHGLDRKYSMLSLAIANPRGWNPDLLPENEF